MNKIIINIIIFLMIAFSSKAQNLSNFHTKYFYCNDSIQIDSKSIIKNSILVFDYEGDTVPHKNYKINNIESYLIWFIKPKTDSFKISYRSYPYSFTKRVFTNDYNQYKNYTDSVGFLIDTKYKNVKIANSLIDFGKLSYDGDFSRGVSFGNGQDLNVNSSFNLQLAGMLSKDIEINAAITDNNIPIQPEGNTAKIQDFDKIFIQLRHKKHFLKVGDFDIQNPSSYFMRFHKNLQGISYWGEQAISDQYTINNMASIAISKGNYAVNELVAEEGNQGPYKLNGINGETYIIVISGSEQVFLNGEKLQRGSTNDYVIDYNLGEIRFTPKRMVTKDLRIKVEFEYADKSYLRILYHINSGIKNKKWSFDTNFYSEQDIKNQTINQDLSDNKKQVLTQIGDSIENAFFSGANRIDFSNNRVLYELVDTILDGVSLSFYQYSTDSTKELYSLNFSYKGEGKGNYSPIQSVANGRVFEWKTKDNFQNMQGSYEPVILLITPKNKQLFTTKFEIKATESTLISTEMALSNVDVNTFSEIDDEDDSGMAVHFTIADTRFFKDSSKQFLTKINYEFKQNNFIPLERYRNIEFQRNWNTEKIESNENEQLAFAEFQYVNTKHGNLIYRFSLLNKGKFYNGFENKIIGNFTGKSWKVITESSIMTSNSISKKTSFFKPKINFSKTFLKLKSWKVNVEAFNEINQQKDQNTDTLIHDSFWWQDYTVSISSSDSVRNKFKFIYNLRFEHLPFNKKFNKAHLMANTFSLIGEIKAIKGHTVMWNLTYRNLKQDSLLKKHTDLNHYYLGRVNYRFVILKGLLKGSTLYELGSGREQKTQYNYIESPDGQGNYAWKDINNNGIQELDEFYSSSFITDNKYLRVITNTLEFQSVNSTKFNQSIRFSPKAIWFNKKGIRGFIARFSNISNIRISKKIFAGKNVLIQDILNPISESVTDTILVSNSNIIRNILFFNRTNTIYSLEYRFKNNSGTNLLTSGFEKRKLTTHIIKARWNFNKSFSWISSYTNGLKENDSDFYFDRKYVYVMNEAETNFQWLYKSFFRIGVRYKYAFRENLKIINGGQYAVINETGIETKFTKVSNYSIQLNLTYTSVAYNDVGHKNEQLQIDMLQSLQNGNNFIWSLSLDKTISKNFQVSVIYDGRKIGESEIIHTGRAQVRAIF